MVRLLKAVLVLFVGLQGLFYALGNLVNINVAYQTVSAVVTTNNHTLYPNNFGPAITAPAFIWAAVAIIIAGETLVGLLGLKGAFDLFIASGKGADKFNVSKRFAILAGGMAMIVWFGFFMVGGGAYFQMWQTEIGVNSYRDAFMFAAISGIVTLFVNMRDD